jgi:predicted transcriptional regulator
MARCWIDIAKKILLICTKKGASKTKITYQANLNFNNSGIYLAWLIGNGLVKEVGVNFEITPRGLECLESLKESTAYFSEPIHLTGGLNRQPR